MATTSIIVNQIVEVSFVYFRDGHLFDNYPGNPASVNYVSNFNRQNQTIHIQTLTTLDRDSTQTFHGAIKTKML